MIGLFFLDILINRITIFPSFIFLMGLLKKEYISILVCGLVMDLLLMKMPYNTIILSILYLINRKYFQRKKIFKNYYLVNFFNLVIYYTVGFLLFNGGIINYLISITLIILFNSVAWLVGYSFYKSSYN